MKYTYTYEEYSQDTRSYTVESNVKLTEEERQSLTRPLKLVIGDYKPDTLNQREMVQ